MVSHLSLNASHYILRGGTISSTDDYGVTRVPLCLYVVAARICTFEELDELTFGGVVSTVVLSREHLRWYRLICSRSAPADKEVWARTKSVPYFKLSSCDFNKKHKASLWIMCSHCRSLSKPGFFSFGPSCIGRMCKFTKPPFSCGAMFVAPVTGSGQGA